MALDSLLLFAAAMLSAIIGFGGIAPALAPTAQLSFIILLPVALVGAAVRGVRSPVV